MERTFHLMREQGGHRPALLASKTHQIRFVQCDVRTHVEGHVMVGKRAQRATR